MLCSCFGIYFVVVSLMTCDLVFGQFQGYMLLVACLIGLFDKFQCFSVKFCMICVSSVPCLGIILAVSLMT